MHKQKTVLARPVRPILIFDGDCGFCRRWISRWRRVTGKQMDYLPAQEAGARFPEISPEDYARSIQLVEPDGRWSQGTEAIFRSLALRPSLRWMLWGYEHIPGAAAVMEIAYQAVARHRMAASRMTNLLWGRDLAPSSYRQTRTIFLGALAIIYLLAFASLRPQIVGLLGENGIMPARLLMEHAHVQIPGHYHVLPTLAWWRTDDAFLRLLCDGGMLLSILALFQVVPPLTFLLLWLFYLSITTIGGDFLSFQWDNLLLETGFLAIFLAPFQLWSSKRSDDPPNRLILWMLRWLLFRLMVQSALVKWMSGDPTWHHLTALQYYYETMPLPNSMSWVMHQLPAVFHRLSAFLVFVIEGFVPLCIFSPRRPRLWACGLLAALQGLMLLTGNYGFFNWLTLALCLLLLDDQFFRRWILGREAPISRMEERRSSSWPTPSGVRVLVACLILWISALKFSLMLGFSPARWLYAPVAVVDPFRSVNNYGLFAVMTSTRPEIIVEGSDDGITWKAYEFRFKIQDLDRRPRQVAPHMPRLDWQMWFAALSTYQQNPWFMNFSVRLLQGSPAVLALLKTNPFPEKPPKYLRAQLYEYHFTDWPSHRETGAWWRRTPLGLYCPPVGMRKEGR